MNPVVSVSLAMQNCRSVEHGDLWKGAIAGLAGGLVGTWVMTQFQTLASKITASGESESQEEEPATVKAASAIAENVFERSLGEEAKKASGQAVHYGFGTSNGVLYGMAAEAFPVSTTAGGALFGAALWLVADETVVPALGLSAPPSEYPVRTHVQALASHLVYGMTTDAVRRTVRRVLRAEKETGGPEVTRQRVKEIS